MLRWPHQNSLHKHFVVLSTTLPGEAVSKPTAPLIAELRRAVGDSAKIGFIEATPCLRGLVGSASFVQFRTLYPAFVRYIAEVERLEFGQARELAAP